jgi:hypothetical protein
MDTKSSTSSQPSSNSNSVALILTFCAISALLIFLVYSQNIVFGSKAGLWTYPYFRTITSIPLWIPISVLLLLGLFIFIGSKLIVIYPKLPPSGKTPGNLGEKRCCTPLFTQISGLLMPGSNLSYL